MDCIFCKIINKEIPSYQIYEDEFTYAFLDIAGDLDGHTLVIPKKHVENILDCDEETLSHVMNTVRLISKHYVENVGYDGVNIMNANNKAAEQSVFHLHFHILPRRDKDGISGFPKLNGSKHTFEEMVEKLALR